MSDSTIRRFLFEGLDIRGAVVHLGDTWQQMQADRNYQPTVAQLLGETAAVTALIAGQLKQPGRLTLQLRGNGPIQLLVLDCNEQLQMRGMARSNPVVLPAPVTELLGVAQGGQGATGRADAGLTRVQHAAGSAGDLGQGGVRQGVEALDARDFLDQIGGAVDVATP